MQKAAVLRLSALLLVLAALPAHYAIGRLPVATSHLLPIEAFPKQIGEWRCVEERSMAPEIQRKLPTAHQVDRTYQDHEGHQVQLLLLTASRSLDFHDPRVCFPGQGWQLNATHQVILANQQMSAMTATLDGTQQKVLYWWVGDFRSNRPHPRLQRAYYGLRGWFEEDRAASLFVRIMGEQPEPLAILAEDTLKPIIEHSLPYANVRAEGVWRRNAQ